MYLQEECKGWDINDVVFSPSLWSMYEPLLRADFRLFDEYQFNHMPYISNGIPNMGYDTSDGSEALTMKKSKDSDMPGGVMRKMGKRRVVSKMER